MGDNDIENSQETRPVDVNNLDNDIENSQGESELPNLDMRRNAVKKSSKATSKDKIDEKPVTELSPDLYDDHVSANPGDFDCAVLKPKINQQGILTALMQVQCDILVRAL